ncbi:Dethiobiotin synthase [Candidatus Thiomargarita nelsonii]|uniref:ATP-dependent dethiobiotin synthetase BioD n=1 Tax=Candidatus Thiomargarita nelsonii TaxID=1003181 RepID=A0A176RU54_9GAMM|nr:Dethiobiotin synthase [Candidatus Thiomargarita nelsonii]
MNQSWFITGTDTEIGKTWCTLALIQHLKNQGLRVAGMKPIAAGCYQTVAGLRNSDAQQILELSGLDVPYDWINPYAFAPPIAPHLAAAQVRQSIDLENIIKKYQQLAAQVDSVVIEGVGGWRVPMNARQSLKDMVLAMDVPVILVVGLRLGCINHALLSAETIIGDGCTLAGWIANPIDSDFDGQASIDSLSERLEVPLLAQMPYLGSQDIPQLAQAICLS